MPEPTVILTPSALNRVLTRMAHEIAEKNEEGSQVVLVGIPRGGTALAARLSKLLEAIWQHPVPAGSLDVSMHRDDLGSHVAPVVHGTSLPCDVDGRTVVLVDDVFFSGRTVRAALDALHDFGRPRKIQLAVLVDRGHRELPIKPDFVGKNLPTSRQERVDVRFKEEHGEDAVHLHRLGAP
ncbi:MAG: bifunctional pyr operon transcriptional regulator/uracil phosphoribosyltransferase PyrR [Verrucomicrobia bacterium]|nr:bifunctional pyr operon transcriptional regulator/uracil phosphoribosyltransferase PyrR [Verrucomicrobiota bacterium]MBI3868492.1 bifunctional pyr operon transcriptional regulator/uracil phosphoribosyltransferase PyrR [Verrucomicrobiota bacterium]